ncbi:MAG: hypothetical protein HZB67_05260 [Candidatus Aenigmarchaeota archaeon]|nr:hypothetical protein [Candidatus Aenigmarchaeota archaeon]MBI5228956.1 hypothetical protein [Candidatus Micrarchaeota archaeon]
MKFLVIKKTKNQNLLLKSEENEPIIKKMLFLNRKQIGYVFETIGLVEKPFYLAKAPDQWETVKEGTVLEGGGCAK